MTSTTNCTVIHYGTTWDDSTLLESIKQTNLELERKDGFRRHFRYDYQAVGRYNPDYLKSVEMEKQRLGENHPLFLTQYRLLPLHGGGGFLNPQQLSQLAGSHPRRSQPQPGKVYVAGIDLAGEAETDLEELKTTFQPRRDSTVVTIGELDFSVCNQVQKQPRLLVTEHYSWSGQPHHLLYSQLVDLLKHVWHCKKVVVDSTGIGEPVAAFLEQALGRVVVPFKFTSRSKSDLGFNLLAAVNSGRLKTWAPDGSPEYRELWHELNKAKSLYRPNQTLNFFVPPAEGHDDFLMSLALLVEAAGLYSPRSASGRAALSGEHP